MQNIGLGLISIFIPIAIFLFDREYDKSYIRLDKSVVLDYVIKAPSLLWKIALVFSPLLLWDVVPTPVKALLFVLWALGVSLLVEALANAYTWVRNERIKFRFAYLKQIRLGYELEELWSSVWGSVNINSTNENKFFDIFSTHVKALLESKKLGHLILLKKMLSDFQLFVSQRSYEFLIKPKGVFEKCLEWHFEAWKKAYSELNAGSKELKFGAEYDEILRVIDTIVGDIIKRALEGKQNSSLYVSIHNHGSRHMTAQIKAHTYPETLVAIFFNAVLKASETSKSNYTIWKSFPSDWLITNESLASKTEPIIRIIFNEYRAWLQDRLMSQESGKLDFVLEDISKTLFLSADPFFLATIMTLCHRTWYDSKMKSLVEIDRSFGLFGRIRVGAASPEDLEKNKLDAKNSELDTTAQLLLNLLPQELAEKKLKAYVTELQSFRYDQDDRREHYRMEILNYLNKLLEVKSRQVSSGIKSVL